MWISRFWILIAVAVTSSCTISTAKRHYVLAEKLWSDGKYAASVAEFEKVSASDPKGRLGLQALYRAAMTQTLFLGEHPAALRKLKVFVEAKKELSSGSRSQPQPGTKLDTSAELISTWEVEKQIGEILFSKVEQYEQALRHYQGMLQEPAEIARTEDFPEIMFRVGKSQFFLWRFSEAIASYRGLLKKYSGDPWAERAGYEIGVTYFTQGEQKSDKSQAASSPGQESYRLAIRAYEEFIASFPKSTWIPQARFGIASCEEEMDQLDAAFQGYRELLTTYPSPNVIRIKLARIEERKTHRSR